MKNFISIVRKYRLAMAMNFIGLVLAFTAFIALMVQVEYQLEFDRHYPTAGRIYRVDKVGASSDDVFRNILPRGYVDDIIGSSPHITAGTISCPYVGEVVFNALQDNGNFTFRHKVDVVYPGFFDVFGVEFIEGSAKALEDLQQVAIPESLAEMIYGSESAIGKILKHTEKYKFGTFRNQELTIGAVYKDIPENSQAGNNIYMNIGDIQQGAYGGANYLCWVLLDSKENKETVERNFNENYNYGDSNNWLTDIQLTPIEDIYFGESEGAAFKSGSRSRMWLMVCISMLIMLIGAINYANFFTALAPLRVKSINTQKVFGSSLARLRTRMICEALIFAILAFIIALCIAGPVTEWLASQKLIEMSFSIDRGWKVALVSTAIAVCIGTISGLYPSFYVTSLPPAFALKGNFAFSASGRRFRTVMMLFQYVITFILLVFVIYVNRQNRFMMGYESGFDKDALAVVEISQQQASDKGKWLKERLCNLPEVEDVAFSLEVIGQSDNYSTSTTEIDGKEIRFYTIFCSENFLRVIGIPVLEGRDFLENDPGKAIINQKFREMGGTMGWNGMVGEIIGVSGPARLNSLRTEEVPVCWLPLPKIYGSMGCTYIRLREGTDKTVAKEKIYGILDEMDPDYIYEVMFYDQISGRMYGKEIMQGKIVSVFSFLAAMLSLVGIFGQVILDVQYRRRDIAVRKVYGAGTSRLLKDGLRKYAILTTTAFAISAPVAWYAVSRWLRGFVESAGMTFWPFAASFIMLLSLTMAIVAYQYLRAANADPSETLKTE